MIPRELMEKLRYIEIHTVRAARNYLAGDYRSPLRGRSFEFDQHKRYQHGDDYRQIDWNVTARTRHPYIKKDFEEKEMNATIVADLSRSMEFATVAQSKRELLLQVAATLAFSAAADGMKVGLVGFTDGIELDLPAKKGSAQLWRILEALWDSKPRSVKTNFPLLLEHLETRLRRPSLLFLISDFITPEDFMVTHSLGHLAQKHDLVPLILEDNWEEALPEGKGFLRLQDTEMGGGMLLNLSAKNRDLYEKLMRERKLALKRSLYRLNLNHLFLRTGKPYLESIIGFFLARKRRR